MNRGQKQLFAGLLLLLASTVILIHEFDRPKVKDASDLYVVSGHVSSYSFQDLQRGWHHYVIRLSEYQATFQISADFIGCFSKATFESDLKSGDPLWVSIPKTSEKSLTSDQRLFIFSARTKSATYLDEKDTLKVYNSGLSILLFILFFLVGLGLIIFRPRNELNPEQGAGGFVGRD